jgi:hypothetical protein
MPAGCDLTGKNGAMPDPEYMHEVVILVKVERGTYLYRGTANTFPSSTSNARRSCIVPPSGRERSVDVGYFQILSYDFFAGEGTSHDHVAMSGKDRLLCVNRQDSWSLSLPCISFAP